MNEKDNIIIESLGVYLPTKVVSTKQALESCRKKISFPIEELTGIRSTRVAGDEEFAIDLAKRAITDCLAHSQYEPQDIDLLICCNISRCDGAGLYSSEPSTAIKLRKHFGFERALAFDVSNACPGMFTAIKVVESFLQVGAIRRALVVSGEYLTHLTRTAQMEVDGLRDPRLACLTLGDAGAAVILENSADDSVGFHDIDLYTAAQYSDLCIAKATDQEHGGAIMYTQAVKLAPVAVRHATAHSVGSVQRHGWSFESIQHLVPHQTSRKTLADMSKGVNQLLGRIGWAQSITIDNLAERGNTATTSHFVAIADYIRKGKINSGDNVVFSIVGSGLTVGTALYTFDNLPERLRRSEPPSQLRKKSLHNSEELSVLRNPMWGRVSIQSVGTVPELWSGRRETVALAKAAAEQCLAESHVEPADVGLLIFSGVYRTDFLYEPAIATMVAGTLNISAQVEAHNDKKTLAFDVFNSGLGFLNGCHVATQMMFNDSFKTALVVASEVENNGPMCPEKPRGVAETGSAVLLSRSDDERRGFGNFVFDYHDEYLRDFEVNGVYVGGTSFVRVEENRSLEDHYLECIPLAVEKLLRLEEIDISQVQWILPAQRSSEFISKLSERMNIERKKFVDVVRPGKDLFTSALAHSFQHLLSHHKTKPGDVGLLIDVGAGIQVGCAIYYF